MVQRVLLTAALAVAATGVAAAQETGTSAPGAGAVEITAAPVGAMFFTQSKDATEPHFGNYSLGGSVTGNVNDWIGIEGDVAYTAGMRQDLTSIQGPLTNQQTPNMLSYMGNVVYSPLGSRRSLAPYAVGGVGALTMFNQPAVANLGVSSDQTYFAGDIGAGARWFVTNHWGVRGDYRFIMVRGSSTAPAFFGQENRFAHRVSGSIVLTY